MTFVNVDNMERLMSGFDGCEESVSLVAPDGAVYDWKTHRGALRAVLSQVEHVDRLEVRVRNADDQYRMLRLMMQLKPRQKTGFLPEEHAAPSAAQRGGRRKVRPLGPIRFAGRAGKAG